MDSGLKLWGIMTASAIVLSNDSPTLVKVAARLAKIVFGARIQVCGATDNQVQIQAAIDALPDTGGKVLLMEGEYSTSAPIHLYRDIAEWFNVWIDGAGGRATRIHLANNSDCNMIDNIVLDNLSGRKRVSNLTLTGHKANQASGHGIYCLETGLGSQYDMTFNNMTCVDMKEDGLHILNGWGVHLDDLITENCDGKGIYFSGSQCYFKGCFSSYNGEDGFHILGSNQFINDCDSWDNDWHGFYIGASASMLTSCHVNDWGDAAASTYEGIDCGLSCVMSNCIVIGDGNDKSWRGIAVSSRSVVTGSRVTAVDPAGDCIYGNGDDMVINGNYMTDGANGVHLDNCDDVIVTGNRIKCATAIDINAANCVRPMIKGNNWEGSTNNPSYAAAVDPFFTDNLGINGLPWKVDTKNLSKKLKPNLVRYVIPGWTGAAAATAAVAGVIYYIPIYVTETTTYIRVGIMVTIGAVGNADLRLFEWDDGVPGALVANFGVVDHNIVGVQEIVIAQELIADTYYFLAVRFDGAPTCNGLSDASAITCPVAGQSVNFAYPRNVVLTVTAVYADPAPAPTGSARASYAFVELREN